MPKIEDKTTYFELNGMPHPKDSAKAIVRGDKVVLIEIGSRSENIVKESIFSNWTDSTDTPYASKAALLTALGTIIYS